MNKATIYLISLLSIVLTLGSCTRNHGDIGPWFGTWHVESITAGDTLAGVEGDYFFQFQSKVFRVSQVYGHEQLIESYGTWEENDGTLTVTFPDPSVYYISVPGLDDHNVFTVAMPSPHDVTLTKTDATGITYTYQLKKQP